MIDRRSRRTLARAFVVLAALSVVLATAAYAGGGKSDERGEGSFEALEAADQYAEARTSPADTVDVGAYTAAFSAAQALPVVGGTWDEVTTVPYDSDAHGYRDPVWSNSGGGAGIVSGRVTAIAADGDSLYVGTADGGVWKSTDGGTNWAPLLDDSPTLSIGAVQINPSDHSIWVGTGEANSSSDSYAGIGVLRSTDGGSTWTRVGGPELENHTTVRLLFDGTGTIWAATNKGLFRHSASSTTGAWDLALKPCVGQHDTTYISDIVARPGTNGNTLVAAIGWRGGSACNGFYLSTNHGASFARVPQTGAINDKQIGRVTLAYTPNGRKLIAIVQSSYLFNHTNGKGTMLMGVFSSTSGPAGPWSTIAESNKLADSGSALQSFRGYKPGEIGRAHV